ncbi:MAG TPA: hypothetical protein VGR90_04705 [Acidimicrobiales bacterium]|nr:hypothetical protein [Acidimicrobiales bacterium]
MGRSEVTLARVHVIGGMGTGTTYLARRLGTVLRAPVYEMDLGFDARAVLRSKRWVTEGIYLWDIDPVLEAADAIVWLDLPYRTCVQRIVLRHIWASARRQNRHKGLRKLGRFVWSARAYWQTEDPRSPDGPTDWGALSRAQTLGTLQQHMSKTTRLRSQSEVMAWLGTVSSTAAPGGL